MIVTSGAVEPSSAGTTDPLLRVRDLRVDARSHHGAVPLLAGVSFELDRGQILGLVGETGAGKSLTGWSIIGLLPAGTHVSSGEIWLEGINLLALGGRSIRRIRGRDIGLVVQNPSSALDPVRTLGTQLRNVFRVHANASRRSADRRMLEVLAAVSLPASVRNAYPHELSGGMAQRGVIAMALMNRTKLLVADEPTTGLDVTVQAEILDLLRDLVAQQGLSILLVTHDIGVVANYCTRVAVMYAGAIVESAPTALLFEAPQHPYTAALISAATATVHGEMRDADRQPAVTEWNGRCAYAARCPAAAAVCTDKPPPLRTFASRHEALCHQPWKGP